MKFVTVDGINLHYAVSGDLSGSVVPLVFINSLGTDLRIWDDLLPHLPESFPTIRYDKRGHGLSDCPPGPYTIRDHSNDLAALLAHLRVGQTIMVGISVGGVIALEYTLSHPQNVCALILSDTAAKIGTAEYWDERIRALQQEGLAPMADAILARWFAPAYAAHQPAAYRGYATMLARAPLEGYIATCAALRDADLREHVGEIDVKSLVLCGADDPATPPELGQALAESLADARFELIDAAGHLPCIEQPAAMAAKINPFVQTLPTREAYHVK